MAEWNARIAEAVAAEAIETFAAQGDPFAFHHTVQITSLGGSGTTALTKVMEDEGLDLPRGPAQWPHKHMRRAPEAGEVPDGFRVLYPVGDPRDTVLSIFRRGIQAGHWRALLHNDPEIPVPASLESLDTFLAAGVDEFDLAGHFAGWFDHPPGYPVMFLRFDFIDDVWDEVAAFVGLADSVEPVRHRPRTSDWRAEPAPIRDALDALYGELAARIDALPPIEIR